MEESTSPDISWFDQVKIQTDVLLPVLQALRAEIGRERANKLVYSALRDWMKVYYKAMADKIEGSAKDKWYKITKESEPTYIDDLEIEKLEDNSTELEFNVTGCRFAEYFRKLGEPELGAILNCEADNHVADIGKPEVVFTRSQTLMSGGKCCDFRYRFKSVNNN